MSSFSIKNPCGEANGNFGQRVGKEKVWIHLKLQCSTYMWSNAEGTPEGRLEAGYKDELVTCLFTRR